MIPLLAKKLEENGASAIMPLASPIGSGLGIQNKINISLIIKQSKVPVIIDVALELPLTQLLPWNLVAMEF